MDIFSLHMRLKATHTIFCLLPPLTRCDGPVKLRSRAPQLHCQGGGQPCDTHCLRSARSPTYRFYEIYDVQRSTINKRMKENFEMEDFFIGVGIFLTFDIDETHVSGRRNRNKNIRGVFNRKCKLSAAGIKKARSDQNPLDQECRLRPADLEVHPTGVRAHLRLFN
eukprot:6211983-Pleurochrysis_carterae.AAC.2